MKRMLVAALFLGLNLLAACGGGSSPGAPDSCVPGATVPCPCDGRTGTQTCLPNGTFGACDCSAECHQNTECPTERPICSGGICHECAAHPDCPASRPICTPSLTCVECRYSSDCSGTKSVCDEGTGTCEVCLADSDCSAARPHCATGGSVRACVECINSGDCAGGTCDGAEGRCIPAEDCANLIDDDEDGLADCEDTDCGTAQHCVLGGGACTKQVPDCEDVLDDEVQLVCMAGRCGPSTPLLLPDGSDVKRSTARTVLLDAGDHGAGAAELLLVHPRTTTGGSIGCANALAGLSNGSANVVYRAASAFDETFDDATFAHVPMTTDGLRWVAVMRLWTRLLDGPEAGGEMVAVACLNAADLNNGDGYLSFEDVEPACDGTLSQACSPPTTCVAGRCVDIRCGECSSGTACRQFGDDVACWPLCGTDVECGLDRHCEPTASGAAVCLPDASPCNVTADCGTGEECFDGLCLATCRFDSATGVTTGCETGQTCHQTSKFLAPEYSTTCALNSQWATGRCGDPCEWNWQCGEGETCLDGRCVLGCQADVECSESGGFCDYLTHRCTECRTGSGARAGQCSSAPYSDCDSGEKCALWYDGTNKCVPLTCIELGGAKIACRLGQFCADEPMVNPQTGHVEGTPLPRPDDVPPGVCYDMDTQAWCQVTCVPGDDSYCQGNHLPGRHPEYPGACRTNPATGEPMCWFGCKYDAECPSGWSCNPSHLCEPGLYSGPSGVPTCGVAPP